MNDAVADVIPKPVRDPRPEAVIREQIDGLDSDDPHDDRKFQNLQERQNRIHDEIAQTEAGIAEVQMRLTHIQQQKISGNNVYACPPESFDFFRRVTVE